MNLNYSSIARLEKCSISTIQRRFDKISFNVANPPDPGNTVIIMDTTYFNKHSAVMVFRDYYSRRNIYWNYVTYETIDLYKSGVKHIQNKGWKILGIVCDGRRGLFSSFGNIPVQLCQFHQVAMVIRYITKNPKLQASKELKSIVLELKSSTEKEFTKLLNDWHGKWKYFLDEKSFNPEKNKLHYTHKRLRSAYRSLNTNLKNLFIYQKHPDLGIPNTTNSIEGMFSGIKKKLRNHAGLKEHRKFKILDYLLSK